MIEIGQEKEIFRDVYNLLLKYINNEYDKKTIADEVSVIAEKYNNDRLCNDLLLAIISHIERKFKGNEEE